MPVTTFDRSRVKARALHSNASVLFEQGVLHSVEITARGSSGQESGIQAVVGQENRVPKSVFYRGSM